MSVLSQVIPLVLLIALGVILQRLSFFEEVSFKRMQSLMLRVTIPCLLFTAFAAMQFGQGQLIVSAGMFVFMLAMMLAGLVLYRVLPVIRHDFFPFFLSTFGFGTVAFPVFVEIFGMENAAPMALLGMGHEIFAAGVFIPALHIYYNKSGAKLSAFLSPAIIMVALGAIFGIAGLAPLISANVFGAGLLETISRVGGMTLRLH
ncbi:MAG: hypothetical protein FWE32_00110 [Oscillospiraceae bacterium]|nr:hypothetical protein [Oscillospiraceae bacterium]